MRLYATTTSERASKGQGGNEFLEIVITREDEKRIFEINIRQNGDTIEVRGYAIDNRKDGKRSESLISYDLAGSDTSREHMLAQLVPPGSILPTMCDNKHASGKECAKIVDNQ